MYKLLGKNLVSEHESRHYSPENGEDFFKIAIKKIKHPVVDLLFDKDGNITNVKDLVPYRLVIVPNQITIYLNEPEYRRDEDNLDIFKTSENCVFVYVYNQSGALINPVYEIKGKYYCPYELTIFSRHNINGINKVKIITDNDFDNQSVPSESSVIVPYNINPPNAIMIRPTSSGIHSLKVLANLNKILFPAINVDLKPQSNAISDIVVNAVNDFETIESIYVIFSCNDVVILNNTDLSINIKENESVNLRIVGEKKIKNWDNISSKYDEDNSIVILKNLTWEYKPHFLKHFAGTAIIEALDNNCSSVRVTALSKCNNTPSCGFIYIYGYNHRWVINVNIL